MNYQNISAQYITFIRYSIVHLKTKYRFSIFNKVLKEKIQHMS